MSGIAGILHLDGKPVESLDVERMLERIQYRGPDAKGIWTDGPVGLGHQMLWTTPESLREDQPVSSADGRLQLIADARVDNREELRDALLAQGAILRDDTDAELILKAYETWGEQCPARIIGDFAFAIWDGRTRKLFCARDPIGVKPFYYWFNGRSFFWASAPSALFANSEIPKQANLRLICRMLLGEHDEREETYYEKVRRLPPAHSLVIEDSELRTTRYWQLDPNRSIRFASDAEYVEQFLEVFRTSVASRVRSHVPVGSLLSGGMDSTTVTSVAQQVIREKYSASAGLEALSIVFTELPCDESQYIEEVVQKCGLTLSTFEFEQNVEWLNFEQIDSYPDSYYIPTMFMLGPIFSHARQNGIKAVLAGYGGDELTASSVSHLTDLTRALRFKDLWWQLKHDAERINRSRWDLIRNYCIRPFVPEPFVVAVRAIRRLTRNSNHPEWLTNKCIRLAELSDLKPRPSFPLAVQQRIANSLESSWNINFALDRIEAFSSYFGIEMRHPFFDRRLVEFMFAVPEEQRWHGPWRKRILRNATEGLLPESVRFRQRKTNFRPVIDQEFRKRQAANTEDIIKNSTLAKLGLIDRKQISRLLQQYRTEENTSGLTAVLHQFIGVELWYRSSMTSEYSFSEN